MIKTLTVNEIGRDFVVGDLHGQLFLLENFLAYINFDATVDRIISVGDLVDRGENSLGCLELLYWTPFYAVKGNHEQLMEDYLTGGPTGRWWFHNGGGWFLEYRDENQKKFLANTLADIYKLPWLITVPMQDGRKFHVLHAELPNDKRITDEFLANKELFSQLALTNMGDGEVCIWGRELWGSLYGAFIGDREVAKLKRGMLMRPHYFNPKLSHIYSGHTTVRQPTTIQGQTNLDTGAFRVDRDSWAGLTFTEPLTGKFWTAKADGVREVQPLVIV